MQEAKKLKKEAKKRRDLNRYDQTIGEYKEANRGSTKSSGESKE